MHKIILITHVILYTKIINPEACNLNLLRSDGCDDTDAVDVRKHTVDLMSYIKWCDVLKSGSDVIEKI